MRRTAGLLIVLLASTLYADTAVVFVTVSLGDTAATLSNVRQAKVPAKPWPAVRATPQLARRFWEITGPAGEVLAAGALPDPRPLVVEYTADGGAGLDYGAEYRDEKAETTLCVPWVDGMKAIAVYARPLVRGKPGARQLLGRKELAP